MRKDAIKKKYEKAYSENKAFFKKRPSLLITRYNELFSKDLFFLDLGCGQGADLLFMNKLGHKCLGIDISEKAIEQLSTIIKNKKLNNIFVENYDISKFDLPKNKYGIINARNILQYINKKETNGLINKIKSAVNKKGFIIISAFTTKDPSFHKNKKGFKSYFSDNELLNHFYRDNFNVIYYSEETIKDKGHGGYPPHDHGMVFLLAQKK